MNSQDFSQNDSGIYDIDTLTWKFERVIKKVYQAYRTLLHDDSDNATRRTASRSFSDLRRSFKALKEKEEANGSPLITERGKILAHHDYIIYVLYNNIGRESELEKGLLSEF